MEDVEVLHNMENTNALHMGVSQDAASAQAKEGLWDGKLYTPETQSSTIAIIMYYIIKQLRILKA